MVLFAMGYVASEEENGSAEVDSAKKRETYVLN